MNHSGLWPMGSSLCLRPLAPKIGSGLSSDWFAGCLGTPTTIVPMGAATAPPASEEILTTFANSILVIFFPEEEKKVSEVRTGVDDEEAQ